MKAKIYKQAFNYDLPQNSAKLIDVSERDIKRGYVRMDCPDCKGTGRFELPEGDCECNTCKGTGKRYVSLK